MPSSPWDTRYCDFAADQGHSEAKLNHRHCIRLVDQWESPDHSSEILSHSSSVDYLFEISHDFLENPEPLDEDIRRLLSSFED
jgi:hypothetical protein